MADLRERGKERGAAGRRQGRVRGSRQGQVSVTNGNHALPGQSPRVGVTSDGAENAPRLRVANGEDSQESKPPVKRRVRTHTACAQDSSPPVPWRWGSRTGNRRLQGTPRQPDCLAHRGELAPDPPRRAPCPARAADLSDGLSALVLPSALRLTTPDTRVRFFTPAPTLWLPAERRPTSSQRR